MLGEFKKECSFCKSGTLPEYKDPKKLRRFISDRGRILPRRNTGVCAKHQRKLTLAIKRARQIGLLPYITEYFR